jgi:hypothetical protein
LVLAFTSISAKAAIYRPVSNSDAISVARGPQNPIEIGNDSGGLVAAYAMRMYQLEETKDAVKFVGRCDSACTLFLALPRDQTCVSSGAYFRFHAPSAPTETAAREVQYYMMRKYPKWVQNWINSRGGLTGQLITMDFGYANKYLRVCA